MLSWIRRRGRQAYERLLMREISGVPEHVAIIQDGNRRYARKQGADVPDGHRAGAETTRQVLEWCEELGIRELTLYAFSTENFNRPPEERAHLFDLIETKLREFADADHVHEQGVCIRALGAIDQLPERVQEAVRYAETRTARYETFTLNVALAYGGRAELLDAARDVAMAVADNELTPSDVDLSEIETRLYGRRVRDVDLIIRTGGNERTSNFLPWHANGNEAAVFFCAPYWPEFSRIDFLRAIRTYESREASWQRTRAQRAVTLLRAFGELELEGAQDVAGRLRDVLPKEETDDLLEGTSIDGDPDLEPAD
ncbi:MAG: polyprenyl diphosphate synthase [Halobacteriales archaeon]